MRVIYDENHISHFDDFLPLEVCEEIITQFENEPKKGQGQVVTKEGALSESTDKISIEFEIPDRDHWQVLHQKIHQQMITAIEMYISQRSSLSVVPLEGTAYKIKRYDANKGHFKWHFDAFSKTTQERQIAAVIYLNDVSEGGETGFYYQELKIKPKAGQLLLFPPFWTHMHCGETPKSNEKYIMTSFINFKV